MVKIATMVCVTLSFSLAIAGESEKPEKQAELKKLDAELKPIRLQALHDPEVVAARKEVDEAFRRYYAKLADSMKKIDPAATAKIEERQKLAQEIYEGSAGSRAEDYEAK